jgi:hypothetical protein
MAKKASGAIGGASSTSPQSLGGMSYTNPKSKTMSGTRGTRPSALLDTRVVYCGDNLEQLAKLPDGPCRTGQCRGLPREIMPHTTTPHRLHRISWGETKEKRVVTKAAFALTTNRKGFT